MSEARVLRVIGNMAANDQNSMRRGVNVVIRIGKKERESNDVSGLSMDNSKRDLVWTVDPAKMGTHNVRPA